MKEKKDEEEKKEEVLEEEEAKKGEEPVKDTIAMAMDKEEPAKVTENGLEEHLEA